MKGSGRSLIYGIISEIFPELLSKSTKVSVLPNTEQGC
jgi:hypothetical protein